MKYLRIRNFEKFQHYKDRNPPWIKMYAELWGDFHFFKLADASKAHLLGLFMLASKTDNRIPLDLTWMKHEIRATGEIDVDALLASKFVETIGRSASKTLATRKQSADLEGEKRRDREETEGEREGVPPDLPQSKVQFGPNRNIWLTPAQYAGLVEKYGEAIADDFIQQLDLYPGKNLKKFKTYSDHNLVIQSWITRAVKRGEVQLPEKPKTHPPHICRICEPEHEWACDEPAICGSPQVRACIESVARIENNRAQGATA